MTTMRDIAARSARMTRARSLGDELAAEELAAVLEDAQSLFLTFPIRALTDVLISAAYEAGENERITFTSGAPVVTYPTSVVGSNGDTRPPTNGAIVEVSNAASPTRKIYISELKTWMDLTGLTANSQQPFGPIHDANVSAMIAARISGPVFQRAAPEDVVVLANQGRTAIRSAFRQVYAPNYDRALLGPAVLGLS